MRCSQRLSAWLSLNVRPMKRTLLAIVLCATSCLAVAQDKDPWAMDKPLLSPSGSFSILQHRDEDWATTVHFKRIHAPDIRFTEVYPWPALFYISPDDHWILQIQKSGSGDNISFLYSVDTEGRLWRMEPSLMKLAWASVERTESLHQSDLYHTGIEFRSWDLKTQQLHFVFHGSYDKRDGEIEIPLIYDLQKNVITPDKKS